MLDGFLQWVERHEADLVIPAYLTRWQLLPKNRWFNAYLHRFEGSDEPELFHDHEYWNVSVILRGSYFEEFITQPECWRRNPGSVVVRSPAMLHRIEVPAAGCWSLFFHGPRVRVWGFADQRMGSSFCGTYTRWYLHPAGQKGRRAEDRNI